MCVKTHNKNFFKLGELAHGHTNGLLLYYWAPRSCYMQQVQVCAPYSRFESLCGVTNGTSLRDFSCGAGCDVDRSEGEQQKTSSRLECCQRWEWPQGHHAVLRHPSVSLQASSSLPTYSVPCLSNPTSITFGRPPPTVLQTLPGAKGLAVSQFPQCPDIPKQADTLGLLNDCKRDLTAQLMD